MALVDPRLLAILVCPRCRGRIEEMESEQSLHCPRCERSYPVNAEGVPSMTVSED